MQTREATGGVHNGTAPVDPAAVREELERILASPQFRNSKRHSCFLRLVVEETLNGEAGQVKERTVGVRVFGLEAGYDSQGCRVRRPWGSHKRHEIVIPRAGICVLPRSEEHTSELQSPCNLVCRLLPEKKKRAGDAVGGAIRGRLSTARRRR